MHTCYIWVSLGRPLGILGDREVGVAVAVATVVEQAAAPELTAKARLKAWVKKRIEGRSTLRAPDVATLAVSELSGDRVFLAEFGREMLRTAVYEIVLDVISEGRGARGDISALEVPQSQIQPTQSTDSRVNVKRRLAMLERRYASWWEHVEGKGHVNFMAMSDSDLELAAAERRARGKHEFRLADFLCTTRERLAGAASVRERFTDLNELERIRTECMESGDGLRLPDRDLAAEKEEGA